MTGRTLGNYQLLESLGSGGMGRVYKARDTRLNRLVAIKLLREDKADSGTRQQRFIQEAKLASAMNHPNIVTIYDFFECDGMDCLVMEYIPGKTLHHLIPKQGLSLKQTLDIATQIAEGLSAAHRAGLIHRDIKPSNVIVPDRGPVKVLDFGLAKLPASETPANDDSTYTMGPATEKGVILGTTGYMSPEQAQGKPVDSRSDIFSFGTVLYEMLTGHRAFHEDTAVGTLAAILHYDPPIDSPGIPRPLSRVVWKCLRKNPDDRWQHMSDVKQVLQDIASDLETGAQTPAANRPEPATPAARRITWPLLVVASIAAALATYGALRFIPGLAPSRESTPILLHEITTDNGLTGYPAISRDGKLVAFASDRAGQDNLDIWVQQVGGGDPIRLTQDPADESDPSFSPDGTMIAFRSEKDGGGIYIVPSLGGTPVLLVPLGRNPRFSPDGRWIAYSVGGALSSNPGTAGVFIVSPAGGVPRAIHPEMAIATNPVWSPTSDRLLVLGRKDRNAAALAEMDWWILPIDGGGVVRSGAYARMNAQNLLRSQFPQVFPAPLDWREPGDRILFSAFSGEAANLWEIPLTGKAPPRRVTLGPGVQAAGRWSGDARRMVFSAEDLDFDIWRQPLDPATGAARGEMQRLTDQTDDNLMPSISWDGAKLAYMNHRFDSWSLRIRDSASGRSRSPAVGEIRPSVPQPNSPLAPGPWSTPLSPSADRSVVSSPSRFAGVRLSGDGSRIAYTSPNYDLLSVPSAGGTVQKLCEHCGSPMGASEDGRQVLFEPIENEDVLLYDPARGGVVKLALRPSPDFLMSGSRFSRDGIWVAFHALHNATNTSQIWIAPFGPAIPVPPSEWIAVTDGSGLDRDPAWSPDGRFLYFISERDGFRCIWAQPLNPATRKPSGAAFPVHHFHSARFSLRHVGSRGHLIGLSVGEGALVFSIGELKGNVWLQENAR